MADHKVTITSNICTVYGPTMHKDMPLPLLFHYELPVRAYRGQEGAHSFAAKVWHRGFPIMTDGHDCGTRIIHVPASLSNIYLPIIILFSERKNVYSASTVLMEGKPAACCNSSPYTPMTACNLWFPAPWVFPNNDSHNVLTGMTSADWWAGTASWVISAYFEAVSTAAGGAPSAIGEVLGLFGISAPDPIKIGGAIATGIVKMALTGRGSIEYSAGTSYAGGKYALKKSKTGSAWTGWSLEREMTVMGTKGTDELSVSDGSPEVSSTVQTQTALDDGSTRKTESKKEYHPDGSRTETADEVVTDEQGRVTSSTTTTTKYDADGNQTESETTTHPTPRSDFEPEDAWNRWDPLS